MSIRKFNLQKVFVENHEGVIVISSLTDNGIRFYEFIVTNFNNAHLIYDIYYADLGFRLSDAIVTQYPYDWEGISYMDESSIWEIDNGVDQEEYEEVISEYQRLQKESKEQPWIYGKYLASKYQLGMYDSLEAEISSIKYNSDYLKIRLFRQVPLGDSLDFYAKRLKERYGASYAINHFQLEADYYNHELAATEKSLLESLLLENDHASTYVYLAYIAVETNRYKDAVKYLKILQNKFFRDAESLKNLFENDEGFTTSKEYKSWIASNIIQDVAVDEKELINLFD
jgi:hypothetical protein